MLDLNSTSQIFLSLGLLLFCNLIFISTCNSLLTFLSTPGHSVQSVFWPSEFSFAFTDGREGFGSLWNLVASSLFPCSNALRRFCFANTKLRLYTWSNSRRVEDSLQRLSRRLSGSVSSLRKGGLRNPHECFSYVQNLKFSNERTAGMCYMRCNARPRGGGVARIQAMFKLEEAT